MTISAVFTGAIALSLTFFPQEIIAKLEIEETPIITVLFQILGALYFGFTLLNYMAKGSIIGGIYNKPIVIANFIHYVMTTLVLFKAFSSFTVQKNNLLVLAIIYAVLTLGFGYVFFNNPNKVKN
jgi:hypothetical protein